MPGNQQLRTVKLVHTIAWTFFVCCIAGIYIAAWLGAIGFATICIAIVAIEVGVLASNASRCPSTAVAAQHTDDRAPNFDINLSPACSRSTTRRSSARCMWRVCPSRSIGGMRLLRNASPSPYFSASRHRLASGMRTTGKPPTLTSHQG